MDLNLRPAARLITTIGKDLIKDVPASIVELVKNSYDADSENVNILFTRITDKNDEYVHINISDDGNGMSLDTVQNSWLVPATDYKVNKNKSENKNRTIQGKKGIGRYAVSILGNILEMGTVRNGKKTRVKINWDDFEKEKYLDNITVKLDVSESNNSNGTLLSICGNKSYLDMWNENEIDKLIKELRKLLSPFFHDLNEDTFNINLKTVNFLPESKKYNNFETRIEPIPLIELYNYRLYGSIGEKGYANLKYVNNSTDNKKVDDISEFQISLSSDAKYCGNIDVDLRVFDKDRPNIEDLRSKLAAKSNIEFTRRELNKELKEIVGVGIYRGGFRIRPHGDKGFDWLELDNRRVQNPSKHVGHDQILGYVSVETEDKSHLEEKSARDGIKENSYYEGLRDQILKSLSILEEKRFTFRRSKNKIYKDSPKTVYQKIENLFDFSDFRSSLTASIESNIENIMSEEDSLNAKDKVVKTLNNQIDEIQKKKEKEYEEIKEIIAIYQGQATLGSIVSTVLHEGRKHISWYSNQLPRVIRWLKKIEGDNERELLLKSIDRLETSEAETNSLVKLFNKLDPLSVTKRGKRKNVNLISVFNHVKDIFDQDLIDNNIEIVIKSSEKNITWLGYQEDFFLLLTNLIENSIYWLKNSSFSNKHIQVEILKKQNKVIINIKDNGPGIKKEYIDQEVIFVPGFTAKPSGTGLGLAIAGEAVERNKGKLKALYSSDGAFFQVELGGE